MKFRVKEITFKNGNKVYFAQVKKIFWLYINFDRSLGVFASIANTYQTRKMAEYIIEKFKEKSNLNTKYYYYE